MKKIIMILMLLGLIGGGGYAGYTVVNQKAQAAVDEGDSEHGGGEAAKGEEGEGAAEGEYVKFDPLMLPVVGKNGDVKQMMHLVIVLEVASKGDVDKVHALQPRLTDAYIRDMYGVIGQQAAMKNGMLKVEMLKARLQKATQAIVGKNVQAEVLVQHLQQNPI